MKTKTFNRLAALSFLFLGFVYIGKAAGHSIGWITVTADDLAVPVFLSFAYVLWSIGSSYHKAAEVADLDEAAKRAGVSQKTMDLVRALGAVNKNADTAARVSRETTTKNPEEPWVCHICGDETRLPVFVYRDANEREWPACRECRNVEGTIV